MAEARNIKRSLARFTTLLRAVGTEQLTIRVRLDR
jgi:hypothetical protein